MSLLVFRRALRIVVPCWWLVVTAGAALLGVASAHAAAGANQGAGAPYPHAAQSQLVGEPEAPRPNVVFLLVDTLRADRLGCYGYEGNFTTSVMDALAEEGVLFERAIAPASWTLPSVPSILTGVYPSVHKVMNSRNLPGPRQSGPDHISKVPEQMVTLAEALRDNGYTGAGFTANRFAVAKHGFAQGFDYFYSDYDGPMTPGAHLNASALEWLDQRDTSKPFLLHLHYMDVHAPYNAEPEHIRPLLQALPPKPLLRPIARHKLGLPAVSPAYRRMPEFRRHVRYAECWEACYNAGVSQMDEYLGELREALEERGLWDDALVVLLADHGESLGEHCVLRPGGRRREVWQHGNSNYQSEVHVPLVIRWPEHLPAGHRVPHTVSLVDLLPTLLDCLEIEIPEAVQGRSLCGLIDGDETQVVPVLVEAVKKRPEYKAVVKGPWKLISYGEPDVRELYDLSGDPDEAHDVRHDHAVRVAALRSVLRKFKAANTALAAGVRTSETEVSPEEKAQLQALGYLLDEDEEDPNSPD